VSSELLKGVASSKHLPKIKPKNQVVQTSKNNENKEKMGGQRKERSRRKRITYSYE
jgi:hypothetical protein